MTVESLSSGKKNEQKCAKTAENTNFVLQRKKDLLLFLLDFTQKCIDDTIFVIGFNIIINMFSPITEQFLNVLIILIFSNYWSTVFVEVKHNICENKMYFLIISGAIQFHLVLDRTTKNGQELFKLGIFSMTATLNLPGTNLLTMRASHCEKGVNLLGNQFPFKA